MKKFLYTIFAAVLLTSCSTLMETPRQSFYAFADYRPYTSEGFYISATPYPGECEILGELMIDVTPAFQEIRWEKREKYDGVIGDLTAVYGYERIGVAELLADVVKQAKELGANGVANLKISKEYAGNTPFYAVRATCILIEP